MAVTERLPVITTVHMLDVPEHAPDQPAKVELKPGIAYRVTDVPALKVVPKGLLYTAPVPEPVLVMVSG